MKQMLNKAAGLLFYLATITLLFNFNWILLFRPRPFLSVILGMVILTASQYRKGTPREDLLARLKWNLIFAGFLTTLVALLSFTASGGFSSKDAWQLSEALLPLLYGGIIYLVLGMVSIEPEKTGDSSSSNDAETASTGMADAFIAEGVFRSIGLTNRECHVALKLLGGSTNKEIAAELFISESTVKKHIQNIYQKLGATDRSSFRKLYLQAAGEDK